MQDFTLSQVLPGPNFSNLAVALGYRLAGMAGGVWGLLAIVLPGALILVGAAWLYLHGAFGGSATLLMRSLSAAVVGLVLRDHRCASCAARSAAAAGSRWPRSPFLAVGPLRLPTVGVVLVMAAVSLALHWAVPAPPAPPPSEPGGRTRGDLLMADLALLTWTFLWLSLLCVGGGLGVIPEMERQSVTIHGWLTAREFVDGYTLAQLTPGPEHAHRGLRGLPRPRRARRHPRRARDVPAHLRAGDGDLASLAAVAHPALGRHRASAR